MHELYNKILAFDCRMKTVASIHKHMKEFDTYARKVVDGKNAERELQAKWHSLFHTKLGAESAKSFVKYYRSMRSKKHSGGSHISPAPLTYSMTPGADAYANGRFPVAVDTDIQSLKDMDVYYQNSLTSGCGIENSSRTIPEGMGSNKVGGKHKSRKNRSPSRKNTKSRKYRVKRNKTLRKKQRKQRGGVADVSNLMDSIASRPYIAEPVPSVFQSLGAAINGSTSPVPGPSSPVNPSWGYVSNGIKGLIDPGLITHIGDNYQRLASPAPWQTQN